MILEDDLESSFPVYYMRVAFQGETKREKKKYNWPKFTTIQLHS